ncbi:MAG: RNA polymerase sigma factor [Planctomycetota bacterium]
MEAVSTLTGSALKRGIQKGDRAALRAFHDAHVRPLYSFCFFRLGRDHHATEEVVQETLLLALEKIEAWEPERGDLHTWLAWLARNLIRKANEAKRRFVAVAVPERPERDPDPAEELEESAAVTVALERLPGHYRSVLERKYLRGETVRAIADDERTTEKAVESLLVRAREAFRGVFQGLSKKTESCT